MAKMTYMRGARVLCQEGGPGPTARKQPEQGFFFFFFFFQSSTYFTVFRGGPMMVL